MSEYGEKLKQIRQSLKLTQDEFAFALRMKSRTYAAYERNENKPTLNMLETLCNDYDINLNWFISGRDNMFNTPRNTSAMSKDEIIKVVQDYLEERAKQDNELNR